MDKKNLISSINLNRIGSRIWEKALLIKHPLIIISMIAIAIRLVLMATLQFGYDSDAWATVVRNMESGNGLYELDGYYYTPIWGYILGATTFFQEMFLNITQLGIRVPEMFPIESDPMMLLNLPIVIFTSTVTSPAFNFAYEMPFLLCDLLVGYLIYWLVKDFTGSQRKGIIGFSLWMLCPLVIAITSVAGMFDTFSVLFILLSIILIRRDQTFLGGVMFTLAALTKFFPSFFLPILVAYVLMRHKGDGAALKHVAKGAIGMIAMFIVVMLPQILDGTFVQSFSFIFSRASDGSGESLTSLASSNIHLIAIAAICALALVLIYVLWGRITACMGRHSKHVGYAIIALMLIFALIILIEGSLIDRISNAEGDALIRSIVGKSAILAYGIIALVSMLLGYRLYKSNWEDLEHLMFKYLLIISVALFLYPSTPQYIVLLILFITLYTMMFDSRFMICWVLVSTWTAATVFFRGDVLLLTSLSAFTDIIPMESLVSTYMSLHESSTIRSLLILSEIAKYISIAMVLPLLHIYPKPPSNGTAIEQGR